MRTLGSALKSPQNQGIQNNPKSCHLGRRETEAEPTGGTTFFAARIPFEVAAAVSRTITEQGCDTAEVCARRRWHGTAQQTGRCQRSLVDGPGLLNYLRVAPPGGGQFILFRHTRTKQERISSPTAQKADAIARTSAHCGADATLYCRVNGGRSKIADAARGTGALVG
jgi:hypothetical protein